MANKHVNKKKAGSENPPTVNAVIKNITVIAKMQDDTLHQIVLDKKQQAFILEGIVICSGGLLRLSKEDLSAFITLESNVDLSVPDEPKLILPDNGLKIVKP